MSKYSTEVRFICESLAGYMEQQGYGKVDDILTIAAPLVFDFDFPIFDEDYRLGLEKKILKHFYTREISAETVGLWKLWLNERMNLIMPYYNQLYESELIEFDPMTDTDLDTTHSKTGTGSTTGSSTGGSTTNYSEGTSGEVVVDEDTTEHGTTTGSKNVDDYDEKNSERTETTSESVDTSDKEVMADTISSSSSQTSSSTGTNDTTDAYSETPQGSLSGVLSMEYLTNARVTDNDTTDTSSGSSTYSGSEDKTTTNTGNKDTDKSVKDVYAETDGRQTDTTEAGEHQVDGTKDTTTTSTGKKNSTTVNTNEGSTTGSSQSTEDYVQKVAGKRSLSSFSKYLTEFRQTFLNIDNMVINELNDLFVQLW